VPGAGTKAARTEAGLAGNGPRRIAAEEGSASATVFSEIASRGGADHFDSGANLTEHWGGDRA